MIDDLVRELCHAAVADDDPWDDTLCVRDADEIERLRQENADVRTAMPRLVEASCRPLLERISELQDELDMHQAGWAPPDQAPEAASWAEPVVDTREEGKSLDDADVERPQMAAGLETRRPRRDRSNA